MIAAVAAFAARWELPLLAALSPALVFPGPWSLAAAALILALWGLRWRATGRLWARTPLDLPLALLLAATLVAYSVSPLPALSASKLWGILLGLAAYVSTVHWVRSGGHARAVGWALAALGAGIAWLSLVGTDWEAAQLVRLPWLYDRLPRLIRGVPGSGLPSPSDLFNPREVGGALALLLPLAAARWPDRPWGRALLALAVGLIAAVLALTQTPSALVGAALGLWLMVVVQSRRWRLPLLVIAALGLSGLLALGWLGGDRLLRFTPDDLGGQRRLGFGLVSRLEIWGRALQMAHDMPYTGIGLNTFPLVMDRFYSGFSLGPEPHAHSLFLHTAVDLGLPGLVALLWLLGVAGVLAAGSLRRQPDPALRSAALGSGCGIVAYLVFGLLDTFTLGAKPGLAFWVMVGLLGAAWTTVDAQGNTRANRAALGVHLVALALLGGVLAWPLSYRGPALNAGRVAAQSALLTPSPEPETAAYLRRAAPLLEQAVQADAANSGVWYLLGSVYIGLEEPDRALSALRRGVLLDLAAPLARYAPAEAWAQSAPSEEDPQGLLRVYGQWTVRYPTRAEWHLTTALVYCEVLGDRAAALNALHHGLTQASHRGIVQFYQAEVQPGGRCSRVLR
ncbi:MAG: O-antigen ligase family protein [Chloroflexi bacterium]|nr:O-antigen ligase family protein [Chloroflexota bacterium]